jgi:hypothetical protein
LCTGTKITLVTGEELLTVEIAIDCPYCGQYTIPIAGHHLRAIRDALIEQIDLHPTLTGKDSDVRTLEKIQYSMAGPQTLTNN